MKCWNVDELQAYAELVSLGSPDFIEVKVSSVPGGGHAAAQAAEGWGKLSDTRVFGTQIHWEDGSSWETELLLFESFCFVGPESERSCCIPKGPSSRGALRALHTDTQGFKIFFFFF